MISVNDAITLVKKHCKPLEKEVVKPMERAGNYSLFKDIHSPINMPPFRQSAMDGYAVCIHESFTYSVVGEIKAGDGHQYSLKPGEAVRIFTGSPVPKTANAIVIQEHAQLVNSNIFIEKQPSQNANIRPLGEQVKEGAIALKKGTKLTPAAIGYLNSLGITEVSVCGKPVIAIVTTGNELTSSGEPLPYGKIYESNSKMLQNALFNLKFYDLTIHHIKDDYEQTNQLLKELVGTRNLVIITGGISVGEYDFVGKALDAIAVEKLFYKVKQKPGKPLYFGKKADTLIFALPGNPAAALTCFYIYVYISLQKLMNRKDVELPRVMARAAKNFIKKGDRPQFLKAQYKDGDVTLLEGQSSAMLHTFALSNALVFMPETLTKITTGDQIEVILLPV